MKFVGITVCPRDSLGRILPREQAETSIQRLEVCAGWKWSSEAHPVISNQRSINLLGRPISAREELTFRVGDHRNDGKHRSSVNQGFIFALTSPRARCTRDVVLKRATAEHSRAMVRRDTQGHMNCIVRYMCVTPLTLSLLADE